MILIYSSNSPFIVMFLDFGWCCRFDIEDDESQLNFSQPEHTQIPTSVIPSPTPQEEPRKRKEQNNVLGYPVYISGSPCVFFRLCFVVKVSLLCELSSPSTL